MPVNFGLARTLNELKMPERNNPLLQEIINAQLTQQKNRAFEQEMGIARAKQDLLGAQAEAQQLEAQALPEKLALEKLRTQASIDSQRTNAAMAQQQLELAKRDQMFKQYQMVNELASGVKNADPTKKAAAYDFTLKQAKRMGLDVSGLPQMWGTDAESFVDQAYRQSSRGLKEMELELDRQKLPVTAVVDPEDPSRVRYVRNDQLPGIEGYNANYTKTKTGKGSLNQLKLDAANQAKQAQDMVNTVDSFLGAASKIPTGTNPATGSLGSFLPSVQEANKYASELALAELSKMKGATSDKDLSFIKNATLSVKNYPAANEAIAQTIKAKARQYQQFPAFIQALQSQGVTDPGLIDGIWSQYLSENSVINAKTKKPDLKVIQAWKKYVTPSYIEKYESGNIFESPTGSPETTGNAGSVLRYNPETGMVE